MKHSINQDKKIYDAMKINNECADFLMEFVERLRSGDIKIDRLDATGYVSCYDESGRRIKKRGKNGTLTITYYT